jgi:membrane fusion protein, multidrug efflux system
MGSGIQRLRVGLIFAVAACLQMAACSGDDPKKHAQPTPEAGFIVVRSGPVPLVTELAGRTSAFEVSEVRPQVSGVIRARLFTEGSIVRAGQTLYQIDPSLYHAAVDQARANLANAIASEGSAQAKAERYRPLAQIEAVSKQDYTDARAAANQAHAAVAQQRAALRTAMINLQYTRVPAPISGRIGRSLITTGALVTSGQANPLATIQRLDPIFVDIQQSSTELLALRRALAQGGAIPTRAQVQLILEDGTLYGATGTLEFAEAVVDPTTGTVTLRARFPNQAGLLLPGMFVRARVAQETVSNGILVPQQGVTHDGNGNATVLLVGPGNKTSTRVVTALRTICDKWLVTAGLNAGDKVIVEGLGRIKPGQTVVPVPAGSPLHRRTGPGAGAGKAR